MKIAFTFALALVLHLLLGWGWTLAAGIAGGFWAVRRGWLVGALGVGLDWLVWLLYDYAVARAATSEMVRVLGGILGNLPGVAVVGFTLLLGLVLGALGGFVGTQAARFFNAMRSSGAPSFS